VAKRRPFGTIITREPHPGRYVRFTWQGRTYQRYAGPNGDIARQQLSAIHALLERGFPIAEVFAQVFGDAHGSRLTFRDAVPVYLEYAKARKKPSTYASDERRFNILKAAPWAGKFLSAVEPDDLLRWTAQRQREKATGSTINRDLSLASALFQWASQSGHVDENPCRRVKRFSEAGRERETYLTADESRALVAAADNALRPLLVCALLTGMRRGELVGLRWRSVDFVRSEITIQPETAKTGKARVIPMAADLRAELETLKAGRPFPKLDGTDPVFAFPDGRTVTVDLLRKLFDAALKGCSAIPGEKKPKVTFHCLRHTAASLMVQDGMSIFDVAKISRSLHPGHDDAVRPFRPQRHPPGRRAIRPGAPARVRGKGEGQGFRVSEQPMRKAAQNPSFSNRWSNQSDPRIGVVP
jgi:integrase